MSEEELSKFLEAVTGILDFWFRGPTAYEVSNDRLATIRRMLPRLEKCSVIEWQRAIKSADMPLENIEDINDYLVFDDLSGETQSSDLGSIEKGDLFAPMPTPPKAALVGQVKR